MPPLTIHFAFDYVTKNAVRYEEQLESELAAPDIGTLYLRKRAMEKLGLTQPAKRVKITVEVED